MGGVELVARELSSGLTALGHHPLIFTNRWPKSLAETEIIDGVRVHRFKFRVPEPNLRQWGGWALTSNKVQRQISHVARAGAVDLVNVHCVSSNGRYALYLSQKLQLPLVLSLHGELTGDATDLFRRSSQMRKSWRKLMDHAAVITAPSAQTLALAEGVYGSDLGSRGRVISNGVNLALYGNSSQLTQSTPCIAVVGRLVATKNIAQVVKAYSEVRPDIPHKLVIVGEGPESKNLRLLVTNFGLVNDVEFTGSVPSEGVAEVLHRSQMLVLASKEEAQGIVLLEAMAAGVAVIATNVGGVSSIVEHGKNGLLVRPGRPEELGNAIRQLAQSEPLRQRLIREGLKTAAKSTWSNCIAKYVDAFDTALATR